MAEQASNPLRFGFLSTRGAALYLLLSTLAVWIYVVYIGERESSHREPVAMVTPARPSDERLIPPEALIGPEPSVGRDAVGFWTVWTVVQCAVAAVVGLVVIVREAMGPASRHAG